MATVEQEILGTIDKLHADCEQGPVIMMTYAFNFTQADIRLATFTRMNNFIKNIVTSGTRPWVILADQNADPRFHQHDNEYMYNDLHENAEGQEIMAENFETAIYQYIANGGAL